MAPRKGLLENFDDGTLDLSLSDLQEVPVREVAAISKAVHLDLSSNKLTHLPKTFAPSLTRLVKLDLCQNQLKELPENFGLLINLKHLDLYRNQLTSLPLSFGNLKSLRWLDLKKNPLVPKLAQIAGPCLDGPQCQAAARNVVTKFAEMQQQVDEERKRRQEQRQKQLEQNFQNGDTVKKEQQKEQKKKKKKANASAKTDSVQNGSAHVSPEGKTEQPKEVTEVPKKKKHISSKKPSFTAKVTSFIASMIKFLVITSLVFVFAMFTLSILDEGMYYAVKERISRSLKVTKAKLPKEFVQFWNNFLAIVANTTTRFAVHSVDIALFIVSKVQLYYSVITTDETIQQWLDSIRSGWHIVWIWTSEKYRTVVSDLTGVSK